MSKGSMRDALILALRDIHALLVRHGHTGQAEVVEELLSLHHANFERFSKLMLSKDVWGGAGAVWEVDIQGSDRIVFRSAVIRFVEAMDEAGFENERSRSIASVFQEWNSAGL